MPRFDDKEKIVEQLARAVIRASGPSSRHFWKTASTSATRIRRFSSSSPATEDASTARSDRSAHPERCRLRLDRMTSPKSSPTTICGASCRRRWLASGCRARMHPSAWTPCKDMERDLDEGNVQLLRERASVETNSKVKKEIATGLALAALDGSDAQARLAAISTLRDSLRQDVLNKLQTLSREISRRQLRRERRARAAGRRGCGEIHQSDRRDILFGRPNVVFWAESGFGARADCHRTWRSRLASWASSTWRTAS